MSPCRGRYTRRDDKWPLGVALCPAGARSITLDVSRLGFLGVDGCHAVRRVARFLHGRGGTLRLMDPSPLARRTFQLMGSDGSPGLEIVDTRPVVSRAL